MKFSDKYPGRDHQDKVEDQGDVLVVGSKEYPCGQCFGPTRFISASFHTPFCSEECLRKMWDEYFEACRGDSDE